MTLQITVTHDQAECQESLRVEIIDRDPFGNQIGYTEVAIPPGQSSSFFVHAMRDIVVRAQDPPQES